jgi:hypothetical protein
MMVVVKRFYEEVFGFRAVGLYKWCMENFVSYISDFTERRGREVNTPPSYSGGSGSDLGLRTGYPDRNFSCVFSVPPDVQA